MGPSESAGKKVSAPTMRMTPTSRVVNSGVVTGKVPTVAGMLFFAARLPAIASIGISIRKRPANIATPSVELYQCVLVLSPANAEPLLPVADVYAYKISERPCGPWLVRLDNPKL